VLVGLGLVVFLNRDSKGASKTPVFVARRGPLEISVLAGAS